MSSVADLYSFQRSSSTSGIEGYHVEKKYFDSAKMKEQRILSSKDRPPAAKPVNVSKKTTFIDDVQKQAAKLPSPTSYQAEVKKRQRGSSEVIKHADRQTYFEQIARQAIKKHVPAPGTYAKVQTDVDKTRLHSNINKSETPTYVEACMRTSLQTPGVGNYNANRAVLDHRGNKWGKQQTELTSKKSNKSIKLPSVGTYNPQPSSYRLFSSISQKQGKKVSSGMGGKTQRWKSPKEKKLPFYNILSEWGMQGKIKKKDILSKISHSPTSSRSVYY